MPNRAGAHYDPTTIGLHWFTALLVALLWGGGQIADFFPKGGWRTNGWTLHVALGFGLATVLVWRLVWRFTGRRRLPAADANPAIHAIAEASHYAIYALLFATIAFGVVDAFDRGFSLFDGASMPDFSDGRPRGAAALWHGALANLLIFVAFGHACAALAHHYVLRDGVLLRMTPELHPAPFDGRLEPTDD